MTPLHAFTSSILLASIFLVHNNDVAFTSAFRTHDVLPHGGPVVVEDSTSSMMTLNFASETVITSDVVAVDRKRSLHDFFAQTHIPSLILKGSKNNHIQEVENIDPQLLQQYAEACDRFNALPPLPTDRIFEVTASGLKLPGVQVESAVTIGVKIISTAPGLPGYEFVVIRDETHVKGRFFNKVTRKDKDEKDQTTFSLNRISISPKENGIIFKSDANLSLLVKMPKILLKAIPGANKEMFEKKGGLQLQKTLEDDLLVSLEEFRQEYVRWLKGSHSSESFNAEDAQLPRKKNWRSSAVLPWNWKRAYVRWLSLGLCSA